MKEKNDSIGLNQRKRTLGLFGLVSYTNQCSKEVTILIKGP